jgi:hypothetical protein
VRAVVGHARQIENADLSVPVILACDGQVLDGMRAREGSPWWPVLGASAAPTADPDADWYLPEEPSG